MLKLRNLENNMKYSNSSMNLLAEILSQELSSDKVEESIKPLDSSMSLIPDEYDIKEKVEELLTQTMASCKQNGESIYKIFAMCACIIAGASTVVSCIYEPDDNA